LQEKYNEKLKEEELKRMEEEIRLQKKEIRPTRAGNNDL
jgi:hypothetical protein